MNPISEVFGENTTSGLRRLATRVPNCLSSSKKWPGAPSSRDKTLGNFLNLLAVTLSVYKIPERWKAAAGGNDNASMQRVLFDFLVGGKGQPIDAR